MSIIEVAKLAGCSHATVSRVINQKAGVSPKAVARVQAAIRELNYVPPVRRRGPQPKSVRADNVAVLMIGTDATPLSAPVTASVVHAIEGALGDVGCSLTLSQVRDTNLLPPSLSRAEINGLILHGNPPGEELATRLKQFPAVWIMSPRSEVGYWGDRVCPDNKVIGQLAAEYLIDRGHSRIAFLNLDVAHLGFPERINAFQQAASQRGVMSDVIRTHISVDHNPADFRAQRALITALIDQLAAMTDRPTGLFVPRGQTVSMVFDALRSHQIEPGKDVTVIACDNDPALRGLSPQIPTIDVRPDRIGEMAVQQLMSRIEKPDLYARSNILIEPTLVDECF